MLTIYITCGFIVSLICLAGILHWIEVCYKNKKEPFTNSAYTTTVRMPINTSSQCNNFCSPTARCSMSKQQCFADTDCPGCTQVTPSLPTLGPMTPGNNEAGKDTTGASPNYSSLTVDMGTTASIYSTKNMDKPAASASFGDNIWKNSFNTGYTLFNQRYKVNDKTNNTTMTGDFVSDGPLASNY